MAAKEHFLEQHDPERKDFQIDRIILFSDAVFAIAITLLVIEIKPPEILSTYTDGQILTQLQYLIPKFIGFIVSFYVIAMFWRSHHRIFGFISHYSEKLIWINVFFLFTTVLMPFSTAYYSQNALYNIPYYFYSGNVILTGIANYWMITTVFNPKNNLVSHYPTQQYLHTFKTRAFITPVVFILGIIICPFFPILGRLSFALTWPMFSILEGYSRRKYKEIPIATSKNIKHKKAHSE